MKLPNIFRKATPEPKDFWDWFAQNQAELRLIATGQEPIFRELHRRLQPFDVVFQMSVGASGEKEFIISADGIPERIPTVQSLVNAAPPLSGWKVIAFRQRIDAQTILMNGRETEGMDVWFTAAKAGDKVDLVLYLNGSDGRDAMASSFLLLDGLLGEYDVMTRIGHIDWEPLPADPVRDGLKPVDRLPEVVDELLA